MSMNEVREALRTRFEADAILGATALPIVPPDAVPRSTGPTGPVRASTTTDPDELRRRLATLQTLDETQVRGCRKCGLADGRTQTVFGQGSVAARIVFVGEAPGFEEDRTGQPFVGRAGELLTAMIERGMGLRRDDVYICNVIKCRPPNNRTPAPDEIAACCPYLFEQLRTIQPEVIVALGAPAAQTLLNTRESIGKLRGRFHDFYPSGSALVGDPVPLMPTFHPAYLLRSPWEKAKAWEDLKLVLTRLELPIPRKT
ncbi:MAG: uracil-DNA glycosylase [Phycisphaerae bacterium]|nr:uracil-DNA glycosylase [Phycisphaerae bacterium]